MTMKTSRILIALVLITFIFAGSTHAQSQKDVEKANKFLNEGNAAMTRGEFDAAIAAYTNAIAIVPTSPIPYMNRGAAYNNLDKRELAIKDLDTALELSEGLPRPIMAQIYGIRGGAYLGNREFDKSVADLTMALSLYSEYENALNNRGLAYGELGKLDLAIADFTRAIELRPSAAGYHNRARIFFVKNELDRALADFTEAINRSPLLAASYHGRGLVYVQKGNLDAALKDLSEAVRLRPDAAYLFNRAIVNLKKGNYASPVEDLTKIIEMHPLWKSAYVNRAYAYHKLGKVEMARRDLQKAKEVEKSKFDLFSESVIAFEADLTGIEQPNQ